MAFNVFISYSTIDLEVVNKFKELLSSSLINTFMAEYSVIPGESLNERIFPSIENCNIFLLLYSESAQESEWVAKEIEYAKARNKFILPVLLDEHAELPAYLGDIKYLPAHAKPEAAMNFVSTHISEKAEKMQNNSISVGLLLGGALLWLLTRE